MDDACVCAILKVLASRKLRTRALLQKERLVHAQRRRRFAQRQAQERIL